MTQCPWKIHWGVGQESTTQCGKAPHVGTITYRPLPHGLTAVDVTGAPEHRGMAANGVTEITWLAGDRREYIGEYPGPCNRLAPRVCTLHAGHHGRCAP